MDKLSDYFEDILGKIKEAETDINILIKKIKEEGGSKVKNNKRIISSTSLEPMTRLRKDVAEVKNAQENPHEQFVIDKINDIFK